MMCLEAEPPVGIKQQSYSTRIELLNEVKSTDSHPSGFELKLSTGLPSKGEFFINYLPRYFITLLVE